MPEYSSLIICNPAKPIIRGRKRFKIPGKKVEKFSFLNKDDVKKMNVEFLNVRYDDNKKLAVIDVKKNKLV